MELLALKNGQNDSVRTLAPTKRTLFKCPLERRPLISIYSFSLQREVVNWDTTYLESQIRVLIENLNYVGEVTVTFPLHHYKVVVASSYPPTNSS